MHLIVTRPQADAEELQRKLEVKGHKVSLAPLLDIRMGPQRPIASRPYQAVLITSANGARALAQHPARARLVTKTAYAVGAQTRTAAQAIGFANVIQAGGEVGAIIQQVQRDLNSAEGPLLYLSGEATSGDLEGMLRRSGFDIDRVMLYAAVPATHLPAPVAGLIKRGETNGVLLYSRRTAKVWAKCIAAAGLDSDMRRVIHFCLSTTVASAIPSGWNVKIAAVPSESSMLELVEEATKESLEAKP